MNELKLLIESDKPHLVAVTETWYKSTSIASLEGYDMYKKDREDGRKAGGVVIYVNNNVTPYEPFDACFNTSKLEQVWVVLVIGKSKYLVGCIYRPSDFLDINDIQLVVNNAREYVDKSGFKDLLIVGDFNLPNIKWSDGYINEINASENSTENRFAEVVNDNFLVQHVDKPTFQLSEGVSSNTLDLIFTTLQDSVSALEYLPALSNINRAHLVLEFDFVLSDKIDDHKEKLKFKYRKGNYNELTNYLCSVDWNECFGSQNVQSMYDTFIIKLEDGCNEHIPKIDTSIMRNKQAPWIDANLKSLIRKKKNLRYKNCAANWKDVNLKTEYTNCCNKVKAETWKARISFEKQLVKNAKDNPRVLFRYVNNQKTIKNSIRAMRRQDGSITNDNAEISELLNEQFQSVFVNEGDEPLPNVSCRNEGLSVDIQEDDIKYEDVLRRLKALEEDKACGPDQIAAIVLKSCAEAVALPVTLIFKKSIETGELPEQWLAANVCPLYKKGDKADPSNYRPVSLTCILCKILEGIVRKKLEDFFYKHNLINENQHGFVKFKSCTTNLLETLDYISYHLNMGIPVDNIYLDFRKAFDSVPHRRLVLKLESYGLTGKLLKWIKSFLTKRKQREFH